MRPAHRVNIQIVGCFLWWVFVFTACQKIQAANTKLSVSWRVSNGSHLWQNSSAFTCLKQIFASNFHLPVLSCEEQDWHETHWPDFRINYSLSSQTLLSLCKTIHTWHASITNSRRNISQSSLTQVSIAIRAGRDTKKRTENTQCNVWISF